MRVGSVSASAGYLPRPTESPGPTAGRGAAAATGPTDLRDLSLKARLLLSARQAALQGMAQRAARVADLQERVIAGAYSPDVDQVCNTLLRHLSDPEERS
jgi:hypothetical protein